jgi:hypothetical protein
VAVTTPPPIHAETWYLLGIGEENNYLAWSSLKNEFSLSGFFATITNSWIPGVTMEAFVELHLRIPLPVGGSLYLRAPPSYKIVCPVVRVLSGPKYLPICTYIDPMLQECTLRVDI